VDWAKSLAATTLIRPVFRDRGFRRITIAMLGAAKNAKRSPETGDLSLQVVMVAGGVQPAVLAAVERGGVITAQP
jgi:hypothetical protein